MKRLTSIIITILLLFALAPAAFAEGAADSDAVITVSGADNIHPGDEFTLTASISGDYQVHIINMTFEYDVDALEIVEAEQCDFLKAAAAATGSLVIFDYQTLAASGRISLGVIAPSSAFSGSGELISMTFRLKDGVAVNQQVTIYVAEFGYMPIGEMHASPVSYTTVNSIITIAGGHTPDDGYDLGGSGSGGEGGLTPIPGLTAQPYASEYPSSSAGVNSGAAGASPDANGNGASSSNATAAPDASRASGATSIPDTANALNATSAPPAANVPDDDNGGSNALTYALVAVAAAAIICAAILVTSKSRKKAADGGEPADEPGLDDN